MSKLPEGGHDVAYFKSQIDLETKRLQALCKQWDQVLENVTDPEIMTEDDSGQIRAAIGLANLLVNQRFKQFSGLIKDCEEKKLPKVTTEDLQGFWDMVYFQVEDIYVKFDKLTELKVHKDGLVKDLIIL